MAVRRISLIFLAFVLVASATAMGIVLSRADNTHTVPTGGSTVASGSDLSTFKGFPVFWLGDEYDGYRVDRVFEPQQDAWEEPLVLTYGTCGSQFESGCAPPIVIKTIPRCWPGLGVPDDSVRIRGRAVSLSPNLTLEAGSGTVVIYADKSISMAIARDLVVANPFSFPEYAQTRQNDPLPGSLCELGRLHPRAYPTSATPDSFTPDPHAATVFAALNSVSSAGLVSTYDDAAEKLGWKPLRNDDPRFTVAQEGAIGALRTLKNPLPTFEQMYEMIDRGAPIMFRQEPESYPDFPRQHTTAEHVGAWDVELYTDYGDVGAVFYSGTSIEGQKIRVVAFAPSSDGYTLDDIREFLRTLSHGWPS
jgi:hypothetical protein